MRLRTTRHAPTATSATPTAAATRPRTANGRNWRVRRSAIDSATPPGSTSLRELADEVRRPEREQDQAGEHDEEPALDADARLEPAPEPHGARLTGHGLASRPLQLAMEDLDGLVAALAQPAGQLLGEHDRAVAAAGAADPDRQPALALGREGRDGELEQVVDLVQVLEGARLGEDELADRLASGPSARAAPARSTGSG